MTVLMTNGVDSQVVNPTRVLKYPSSAVIAPLRTSAPGLVQLRTCYYSVHLTLLLHHTRYRYCACLNVSGEEINHTVGYVVTRALCWVGWRGPLYVGDGEVRAGLGWADRQSFVIMQRQPTRCTTRHCQLEVATSHSRHSHSATCKILLFRFF